MSSAATGNWMRPSPSPRPSTSGRGSSLRPICEVECDSRSLSTLAVVHPLPEGEGRGEGERIVRRSYDVPLFRVFFTLCLTSLATHAAPALKDAFKDCFHIGAALNQAT